MWDSVGFFVLTSVAGQNQRFCLNESSSSTSCRSTLMEEHLFWKFEAAMLALMAVFAILVVVRQRWLDRLASEKVRRQIESI